MGLLLELIRLESTRTPGLIHPIPESVYQGTELVIVPSKYCLTKL